MVEEYVEYAGRSEPRERWLRALPLIVAALIGVPFLILAIRFSLSVAQTAKYIFDLGTSTWEATGLVLLSLSGGFCLIAYLVCLFIGSRRRTWRWRIGWAAATVLVAACLPAWWLVAGFLSPAG